MIFVISGPSGVGKTTLAKMVASRYPDMHCPVSFTTRPPKAGEQNGVHYHYVTKDVFEGMIQRKQFAEWKVVHGHYYGTLKADLVRRGRDVDILLEIDIQGMRQIREDCKDVVAICILPTTFEELEFRIRVRKGGESEEEIDKRLATARDEVASAGEFDYQVVNGNLGLAIRKLLEVMSIAKMVAS